MGYTTAAAVKNSLVFEYWKLCSVKLDEDGFDYTDTVFTDEADFLTDFIDRAASFIDEYVGGGPFVASGLLETINRWLVIYDVEQYILSGTNDRVISVSINEDKKRALEMLRQIVKGELSVVPDGTGSSSAYEAALFESDTDGVTLTIGELEQNILLGGQDDATEIPEF